MDTAHYQKINTRLYYRLDFELDRALKKTKNSCLLFEDPLIGRSYKMRESYTVKKGKLLIVQRGVKVTQPSNPKSHF